MARFFVNNILQVGQEIELPNDVVRHISVLRVRITDNVTLFNGDGSDYLVTFIKLDKRGAIVRVLEQLVLNNESNLKITLMLAIIANDKMDLVIQKAVELGVTQIIPIYCQNTQRFKMERLANRIEHWQNIIIAASEQSGRAKLTKLDAPMAFNDSIQNCSISHRYILSPHHAGHFQATNTQTNNEICILIGPEGGFTSVEVHYANNNGFNSVLLGQRILRAETAAIAAISLLQSHYGDFN